MDVACFVIRRIAYRLWVTTAALLLLLALLVSLARVLLPRVADYRAELVTLLSAQLDLPLEVAAIEAQWHGLGPRIRFVGLTLLDRADGRPLLSLEDAVVDIDLPHSLWRGSLQIRDLALGGVRLAVTRHADGTLTVLGLQSGQAPEIDMRDLLRWLASRKRIALRDTVIDWRDEMGRGGGRRFHDVTFQLRNDGSRHQLEGHALLAEASPQGLSFAMDVRGDVLTAGGWDADIYVKTDSLQLEALPWPLQFAGVRLKSGNATVQIWGSWSRSRLQRLEGRLALRPLVLQRAALAGQAAAAVAPSVVIDELAGDFVWLRRTSGWQLAVQDLRFAREGRRWTPGSLQLAVAGSGAAAQVTAQVGYLDLGDLRHLLQLGPVLPENLAAPLSGAQPNGRLLDTYLYYRAGDDPRFYLSGRFEDLGLAPWHGVPGLQGLSGRLVADEQGGMVELRAGGVTVDFAGLFRAPLAAERVAGRCYWQRRKQGWRLLARELVMANADLSLHADLDLSLPGAPAPPQLDLAVDFSASSLEHTSRYLPVAAMSPGLTKWLDEAIVAGRVPSGELEFHGALRASTFDEGGLFEVRFNVLDGVLEYAPGWPRIEEIEAGFLFHNRRLDVQLAAGKSLSSAIDEARISIADLTVRPALLTVEGRAAGPTADVLRFLRESPLQHRFAAYLSDMKAFGRSRLDLTLHKPLAPLAAEVSGALTLDDSILVVGEENALEIKALNGVLRFNGTGLFAEDISGRLLGLDARFAVDTAAENGHRVTSISAAGQISDKAIASLVPVPLFGYLSGATHWQATVSFPLAADQQQGGSSLVIWTDLRGMAIALPPPLFKTPDEPLELTIKTRLPRTLDAPLQLQLGSVLSGVLDVDPQLRLERGEILFGEGTPRLPSHEGLRLRGFLGNFSYSAWQPYVEAWSDGGEALLRSLDLRLDSLELIGREFHQVSLKGTLEDDVWSFDADSKELRGYIEYPLSEDLPLIMELEHLQVTPGGDGEEPADPRQLPALVIHSRQFSYDGIDFGRLELRTSKHPAGMRFDSLTLASPFINLKIHGDWVVVGDGSQKSIFNIVFDSKDLGKALTIFGYEDNIKKGRAHMELVGQWEGGPAAFSPEKLNGTLSLQIKDGRLLEVEPGAGRIFGLVSLQALPRRLSLDFSDIFDKGFSFDKISGTFAIRDGNATTRDLTMEGPAATVKAKGRIGLAARDYDQIVTVVPHVTSGLPVAGVVAGGLGVGAVILLAEQMFKEEIAKMTRVKYRVTGSWENPNVERLQDKPGE